MHDKNSQLDQLLADFGALSEVRIVVADLDGTLLHSKLPVREQIATLVRGLWAKQVRFSIATGRALKGVSNILPTLRLPKTTPIALYNGSYCCDAQCSRIIHCAAFGTDTINTLVQAAAVAGCDILFYPMPIIGEGVDASAPFGIAATDLIPQIVEPNGYQVNWITQHEIAMIPECVASLVMLGNAVKMDTDLRNTFVTDQTSATTSGGPYIEIRPKGSNKGVAVAAICKEFGIDLKSALAIGDNDNDVELLMSVGHGVAVGNASERLRAVAGRQTKLSSARGCMEIMRAVIAAKRYRNVFRPNAEE